jgi:hypothetical protein
MKFINDIDLSVNSDVKGKEVQETSDIIELSMAVLLKKLFDIVTEYSSRQQILNSFSTYAASAFENYNSYRDTLFTINPNASTGGLGFPERFPLTPVLSTEVATKTSARDGPGNKRVLRNIDGTIVRTSGTRGSGILEYDVWITPHESYIKNTNGTLTYYMWHVVTRKDNNAFVEYIDKIWGTTVYT